MNGLPYYKAYPRDFVEGTIGMPFEVKCAYRVLIDLIYMQGGDLPDDPRYISGHLGCSIRKWKSIRAELIGLGKIEVSNKFLTNKRARKELETLAKLQLQQAENASGPRNINGLAKPSLNQPEPEPEPEPELKKGLTNVSPKKDADFELFWASVPRKIGKGAARKAWQQAVKKTDPSAIISAMQEYAVSRQGEDHKFTAHATTWLNQERWDDELQRRENTADWVQSVVREYEQERMDGGADQNAPLALSRAKH